ncbi:MAG TPA: alanyl-tRNA editing protein [Egibacteraceae bacterium]|jgi:misacylated tRNA(Ala) deacylase|nr:alanyl-tRNA editing protein [Egibacteraceae bacterium]
MAVTEELYATDAYRRVFEGAVVAVDRAQGRVALDRTAFYPGGGGQPHDTGTLAWDGGRAAVVKAKKEGGVVWHWLNLPGEALPDERTGAYGELDWERRHALMRTHTALHVLCGVIWADFGVAVTGGNMEPGSGRLDFELDAMSAELGARVERRINEEINRARDVLVDFVDRGEADRDPALIRTKANLIPPSINPLRVIDIVGLDKQADGGTHVASTAEVGRVAVTKTESKGKANKRIRIALEDVPPSP